MNDQDLDRIIDTAASDMIAREPSRALHHAVMARVRESDPSPPRRFVWASVAATAIICFAVAIVLMNRMGTPTVTDGGVRLKPDPNPSAQVLVEVPPPANQQPAIALESQPAAAQTAARRVASSAFPPNDLLSSIEPIAADPLVLSSIDLPPLENQAVSVEGLEIEELTIEPLTASND